ncbi:uncharacterized protein LOC125260368 [Megalobrama amblycephala]|uniref:uncharacterized protein LOC125253121 n=1 Tax=Megalobrama amblycephala TaxID=75352 RepID=UPI0020146063|nr:uncharacterized protein LOC125253121 [Megalobrama amblycephala]XP_048034648.1 uncharacterized protein LOC125260368 [Megalobrama amblycephala]
MPILFIGKKRKNSWIANISAGMALTEDTRPFVDAMKKAYEYILKKQGPQMSQPQPQPDQHIQQHIPTTEPQPPESLVHHQPQIQLQVLTQPQPQQFQPRTANSNPNKRKKEKRTQGRKLFAGLRRRKWKSKKDSIQTQEETQVCAFVPEDPSQELPHTSRVDPTGTDPSEPTVHVYVSLMLLGLVFIFPRLLLVPHLICTGVFRHKQMLLEFILMLYINMLLCIFQDPLNLFMMWD